MPQIEKIYDRQILYKEVWEDPVTTFLNGMVSPMSQFKCMFNPK